MAPQSTAGLSAQRKASSPSSRIAPARPRQTKLPLPVLQLQRTLGNRRFAQLIRAKRITAQGKIIGIQRKPNVGAADDQHEQEADRVTRQVMSMSHSQANPQSDILTEKSKDKVLQTKPLTHELTHVVQQTGRFQHLQRKAEAPNGLRSTRFAGDSTLEACFEGKHRMTIGEAGEAVKKIQQALIDLGFQLPDYGADGKYGAETATAVAKFKREHKPVSITPSDGVVGPKTMAALDALFSGEKPSQVESKSAPDTLDIHTQNRGEKPEIKVKPQSQQNITHTTQADGNKDAVFQFTATVGVQNLWFSQFSGPKQDWGPCNQGMLQIGGKWNWKGIPLGDKLTLFSEPELDVNVVPLMCRSLPGITMQDNLLKWEIMKQIWELSLVGVLGLQDGWLKNWGDKPLTGMIGPQLDWHPWGDRDTKWYSQLKLSINISAVGNRQPEGIKDSWGLAGQVGVGIEIP